MPSHTVAAIKANRDPDAPQPLTAQRVAAANAAPRCEHIKYNGEQCGCPALRGDTRCRFHVHADPKFAAGLPLVEDAASIQLALNRILRGLEFGGLDYKQASLMLYALQIASMNLKRLETAFAVPAAQAEDARERSLAEELLARLDDESFCRDVLADAPENIVPDIKAMAARKILSLKAEATLPRSAKLRQKTSRSGNPAFLRPESS